jgi:hypothetical protein
MMILSIPVDGGTSGLPICKRGVPTICTVCQCSKRDVTMETAAVLGAVLLRDSAVNMTISKTRETRPVIYTANRP